MTTTAGANQVRWTRLPDKFLRQPLKHRVWTTLVSLRFGAVLMVTLLLTVRPTAVEAIVSIGTQPAVNWTAYDCARHEGSIPLNTDVVASIRWYEAQLDHL